MQLTRRHFLAGPLAVLAASGQSGQPVLMDHDGGMPDDYLATALLITMNQFDMLGVVVTEGDCFLEPAVSATRKLFQFAGRRDVPVAGSTVKGVHLFPREWRMASYTIDRLPALNRQKTQAPAAVLTGQSLLATVLRNTPGPLTMLVTGPLSTVAAVLDASPELDAKIREIVWMGGALNVPGNVDKKMEPSHDGSAEWNAYWDPPAVARVWRSGVGIVLCPLDITNHVPVTPEFLDRLARQRRYPLSDLMSRCLEPIRHRPGMYFWDVLATAYLGRPDLFRLREWETVIVTDGPSQGRTKVQAGGRKIRALDQVDTAQFYDYLLKQWAR